MIDLHIHTNYSDGKMNVKELIKLYHGNRFNMISFTDHDSIEAYDELRNLRIPKEIKIVSGIELTLEEQGYEFHVLSYGFKIDKDKKQFLKLIEKRKRQGTLKRIRAINEKLGLAKLNEVDENKLMQGKIPHSYQIANEVASVNNMQYADSYKLFVEPIRANVKRNFPSISDAYNIGFKKLVLAHPFSKYHSLEDYCKSTGKNPLSVFSDLMNKGLSGIEVYSARHNPIQVSFLEKMAKTNKCMATMGSDLHKQEDIRKYISLIENINFIEKQTLLVMEYLGVKNE